jgi:3-phosphoshikimate 1-carboxyvinyltransferase
VRIAQQVTIWPTTRVKGVIQVPGDKSISHRYALLSALADGRTTITNYAPGGDCASTLECLAALGITIERRSGEAPGESPIVQIHGRGLRGLRAPTAHLDCGNSGSTMRMLAGVAAAHAFVSTLVGDASLSRRPMRRVMTPLSIMGARIEAAAGDRPPLTIHGSDLEGIDFEPDVPSAQVKSAVLLAGLQAAGRCRVTERTPTRDHTERALHAFGAAVDRQAATISLIGGQRLHPLNARIPGDISSAAFPAVAAAALPGSAVTIERVGLNPSRTAILDVLRRFGARVEVQQTDEWQGEPIGDIHVTAQTLRSVELTSDDVPAVIDELPVLAVLATAGGELRVTGASELRVKESDRITALVTGLRALGADADELPDGFHIRAGRRLTTGALHAHGDHRLAMAFAIAALTADGPVTIEGADAAAVSYPSFFAHLEQLRS